MSPSPSPSDHPRFFNNLQCLIAQCRFESEWEAGKRPRAEDFVAQRPIEERALLIPRLLAVEVSIRRKAGDEPSVAELRGRFPECDAMIENALLGRATRAEGSGDSADGGGEAAPDDALPKLGRYRIIERIGHGGFGVVYGSYDEGLRRMVAIKVPHARWGARRDFADSYLAEARVLARLDHPNIVPVFDCGETDDGRPFIVSKFIEGQNLAERLADGRPPFAVTRGIVAAVADALHYAHLQGIFHRDVKPANILIDAAGKAYLTDFGIVLREEDYGRGPTFAGTPAYMSPEQARFEGHRVDGRSDVFSLGVVLFQMLTGRRPFHAASEAELLEELIKSEAQPPRQIDDAIPRDLERICLRALAKRASERYPTARDMADDLRQGEASEGSSGGTADTPAAGVAAPDAAPPPPSSAERPSWDHPEVRIVPKGLHSFDGRDADFFLELLPGPRDRGGLPESLRFWKARIETADSEETFSVGLIYGPSGCGKSSLIKAGLVPRLHADVHVVYAEATANHTEARLLQGLRKRFPALPDGDLSLPETLAEVRKGRGVPAGHKALVVIDQFEQWLHAHGGEENAALVHALRQCDGTRAQVLLLVRDDFWMGTSRLFDQLEINLSQTHNARAMDLFDPDHARRVLRLFGEAYGQLPAGPQALGADQRNFLAKAVSDLTRDGYVIPVRLSLFADMMKGRPWTSASLVECGGAEGVGVRFLDEAFSGRSASPELRTMEDAVRQLLQAFLPERGADIRGRMRSRAELAEAAGLTGEPHRFARLIERLDRDLHILTPVEPDRDARTAAAAAPAEASYFQLTHDYLVPSLRQWLTRERQKTWRGRAELCLEERARHWIVGREKGFLPTVTEYASIALAVPARKRSTEQRKLMRVARWHHGARWGSVAVALAAVVVALWVQQSTHRSKVVDTYVNDLLVSSADGVAVKVERLLPYAEHARPILRAAFDDPEAGLSRKLHAACGLAAFGEVDRRFLVDAIPQAGGSECVNIVSALVPARDAVTQELQDRSQNASETPANAARYATVLLHLGDASAVQRLVALRPDPTRRTAFILGFAVWHGDLMQIATVLGESNDGPLCSALCAALGTIEGSTLGQHEMSALNSVMTDKFQNARDGGTHGAAGWALREWQAPAPTVESGLRPPSNSHREWFVSQLGVTNVLIPGETPEPGQGAVVGNAPHGSGRTPPFLMSDCPVTLKLYLRFIYDPDYPDEKKPKEWKVNAGAEKDFPVQRVNWVSAILFCNWLSEREGLIPCYEELTQDELTQDKKAPDDAKVRVGNGWKWYLGNNGYRLPTRAEQQHACGAGAITDYWFGNDASKLARFATYLQFKPTPVRSHIPNPWGLFDMHGGIMQWYWDAAEQVNRRDQKLGLPRILSCGAFNSPAEACTTRRTATAAPRLDSESTGFRVVRNAMAANQRPD